MSTPPTGEEPFRGSSGEPPVPPQWPTQPAGPPGYGPQAPQQPGYPPQAYGSGTYQQPAPGPYGAYGQPPPWQQGVPPAPPPDRKRRRLVLALELVALAIVVAVATLVYVLSSTRLDRAAVERDVAAQFEERNGVQLDLDCRHIMIVEPGRDYECEGTTAAGEEVEIEIRIQDDAGAYTWVEK